MRKLVTIRKIINLVPIENADRIEVAIVDGWHTVVKKGAFKVGDYCIYFEIDSLLPFNDENFQFINNTKKFNGETWRYVKTIKLRKQISQGLALPLNELVKVNEVIGNSPENFLEFDFAEILGVIKYEEQDDINFQGDSKGVFPYYIKKTGEVRIQNVFNRMKENYKDVEFIPTLKMDGSSLTVAYVNNPVYFIGRDEENEGMTEQVWVGSHNRVIKDPLSISINEDNEEVVRKNEFHDAVDKINLKEKLRNWCKVNSKQIAIQAELLGPKIQGNFEKFNTFTMKAFYIYFIDEQRRATPDEFLSICKELDIDTVIHYKPMKVFEIFDTVEDLLLFAEGESINNKVREGLVFKSNLIVDGEPLSFKVISNSFLLGKK